MNTSFHSLMEFEGAEDLKAEVTRWQTLSENLKKTPTAVPVLLPDMLWVAKSGVGITSLLQRLSAYLSERKNLMSFYGDVKFFEFQLNYCPPDRAFGELPRLMNETNRAAGFRSEFKGIIHIDCNAWLEHYREPHFVSLMEYLAANSHKWLVILSVYSTNQKDLHNLEAFLSMYLRIRKISLPMPSTDELMERLEAQLESYGLKLEASARELLSETVEIIRENPYFDGFKSLSMLCQDIVYTLFSQKSVPKVPLTAKDLSFFGPGSEYVSRTIAQITRKHRIGLLREEDENNEQ